MKDNNIDDLFRNGLGSHRITPPSTAWDKVESQLPTKSKKGVYFWVSIAASIILVLSFGWIILSDSETQQPDVENFQAKEDATQVGTPRTVDPEKTPALIEATIPNKQLVAQAPVKDSTPAPKNTIASDVSKTSMSTQIDKLQANAEVKDELLEEKASLELNVLNTKALPIFYSAQEMSNNSLEIDLSVALESYISGYQILTLEPTKKKKFSLLSGIVNVAKGVNSGKLALSEMRKSKNDFFINDLKYGSKEGEPEETKGDIDEN